jgi:thymidine phosphorylase
VRFLKNDLKDERVHEVTVRLGMEILLSTGLAKSDAEARIQLEKSLSSGKAAEIFAKMVAALGGPKDFMEAPQQHMRAAHIVKAVYADTSGHVASIATRDLGLAVIELGGGRRRADDVIDHSVGLDQLLGKGSAVDAQTPLAVVHAADDASFTRAAEMVKAAYVIGDAPKPYSAILERVAP